MFNMFWWLGDCFLTPDHYHMSSNLGMGISEGCFIFHFASLLLEVARPFRLHKCVSRKTLSILLTPSLVTPMKYCQNSTGTDNAAILSHELKICSALHYRLSWCCTDWLLKLSNEIAFYKSIRAISNGNEAKWKMKHPSHIALLGLEPKCYRSVANRTIN